VTPRRLFLPGSVLAVLVFLNVRNQCQPGWCGDFGFPFIYSHSSDEIPEINGVVHGPWFSAKALAADILICLAVVMVAYGVSVLAGRRRVGAAA
jgi:hypothetical protein